MKAIAALADGNQFVLTAAFDPSAYTTIESASNGTFVITFSDSSTLTIYAGVLSVDNVAMENDSRPLYAITFLPTNDNGGVETGPAYA